MSLDMLEAGDWNCDECDTTNNDVHERCRNCGAKRKDPKDDLYGNDAIDYLNDAIFGGDSGNE